MSDIVYLNGAWVPRHEARISPDDRGFLFGDGIYEVTPAYGGRWLALDRHLGRLARGATELGLQVPPGLEQLHAELLERNGLMTAPMAIVYLQLTRGTAPRTHHFPAEDTPVTLYAWAKTFSRPDPERWSKGWGAVTAPDQRWARADIKTVQLLPLVLAQESARRAGETDALLVRDGLMLEGAHNNVFFVLGDTLITHPASNQILPGITRGIVLELARAEGIPCCEAPMPLARLPEVSEIFFTGTTTEVRPTVRVNGEPVGDGRVGPVTRKIHEAFVARVERECGVPLPV